MTNRSHSCLATSNTRAGSQTGRQRSDLPDGSRLTPLTVYYNTKCPVCDAGIDLQRNRLVAAARAGAIVFRDINLEPDALQAHAASLNDVRRRLHAVDGHGELHVGIDCLAAIWRRTPGDGWLGWLVERPIVHPLAALCYDRFADLLYAWNRRRGRW